jgi:hypothetical protein
MRNLISQQLQSYMSWFWQFQQSPMADQALSIADQSRDVKTIVTEMTSNNEFRAEDTYWKG